MMTLFPWFAFRNVKWSIWTEFLIEKSTEAFLSLLLTLQLKLDNCSYYVSCLTCVDMTDIFLVNEVKYLAPEFLTGEILLS